MHPVVINLIWITVLWTSLCPVTSLAIRSSNYKPTSESYIRDKYGLRSNLQSCLTKLSNPKGMDCKGHDKGCCLLIKLSVQRKSAMKKLKRVENENTSKLMNFKRKEKYRSFWDEDQKFDFPRIIEAKQLENKNDIIQRVADGKLDFENPEQSSIEGKTKNSFLSYDFSNEISDEINEKEYSSQSTDNISYMTKEKEIAVNEQIDDTEKFENKKKDVIDEKVFLKWALEKRKNEYESIKRRKVEDNQIKRKLDSDSSNRVYSKRAKSKTPPTSYSQDATDIMGENNETKESQNLFLGGQRRGVIQKNKKSSKTENKNDDMETSASSKKKDVIKSITNYFLKNRKKLWKKKQKTKATGGAFGQTPFSQRYDRPHCATLKVPCRFVSDHACCRFKMPLDLVARARSMDGSADLKWRNADHSLAYNIGGPRSAAQGRSLDWKKKNGSNVKNSHNLKFSSSITPRNVRYNYANTKHSVSIPRYFYKGGPIQIKNLLATCWRLHYLRCPGKNWQESLSNKSNINDKSKEHPCCKLVSRPVSGNIPSNRISRWLS